MAFAPAKSLPRNLMQNVAPRVFVQHADEGLMLRNSVVVDDASREGAFIIALHMMLIMYSNNDDDAPHLLPLSSHRQRVLSGSVKHVAYTSFSPQQCLEHHHHRH